MEGKKKRVTQVLIFTAAVCMIAFGVYRGEVSTVFTKAVNVCLECIGLG